MFTRLSHRLRPLSFPRMTGMEKQMPAHRPTIESRSDEVSMMLFLTSCMFTILNDKGDSYGDDFENGVEIFRDSNTDEITGFQVNSVSLLTDRMLLTYSVLSDNMAVGYPTLILFQGGASYANSYPRIRCQTRFQKKTYTSQHKL